MIRHASRPSSIALMIESDGPGGAERMVIQLAEELRSRGHSVCPVGPARGCGWLDAELRARGFDPETFTLRRPLDWKCVRGMARMLRRRRVQVIHSHEFTMAVYGAAAAALLRLPYVVTMHGGGEYAAKWRRRAVLRWAFRNSRRTVAVSAASRARITAELGLPTETFEVIPNGISAEPGSGAAVRAELRMRPNELLILAVGNLYPVKGHIVLLRALAELKHTGQPWRVAIAGRGGEADALDAFARAHGMEDRLHLLGYRSDVADLLAAADVYVMPSLSEGLPLALIEAMYAGKPVVASAVGGIPEAVTSGRDGILVPPQDPEALAGALARLMEDPKERSTLGAAACERARAEYSVGAMADRYEAAYGISVDVT